MRLATYEAQEVVTVGAVVGGRVYDLVAASHRDGGAPLPADMLSFIEAGAASLKRSREVLASADMAKGGCPIKDVKLLAPIIRPRQNVLAVGLNYREHAAEGAPPGRVLPDHPIFFTKRASSVIGPEGVIPYRKSLTAGFDWEVELAVVIGRGGKNIAREQAYDYVFGYTCANDISARDVQIERHGGQWFKGKSLDGCCPLGPWIVTADELRNPHNLRLTCRVNGRVKQESNTSYMISDIGTLIAEASDGMTLEPGDILLTGTPSGVGFARTPPELMTPGDVVEVEIEDIGTLCNRVADEGVTQTPKTGPPRG